MTEELVERDEGQPLQDADDGKLEQGLGSPQDEAVEDLFKHGLPFSFAKRHGVLISHDDELYV
ncbi:MAG: hypothetical protein MJK04_20355, partial [Psychrosphaera sp.]|nr:hypothetical protein [Psychrosphaera sp.]